MILEVWFDEVYTGAFYAPRSGDFIIDAGANIGLFSLLIARKHPGCQVVAFEPFEENYRLLQENLAAARALEVRTFQTALAGESTIGQMVDGGGRSQDHRLKTVTAAGPDCSVIRTWTLSDVLALCETDSVALFKCDIEGSEYDVFRQADPRDLARIRRYAIEYHDNIRAGILELLQDRLRKTHDLVVKSAHGEKYGMIYATARFQPVGSTVG
jgi:FkbM family methyltransferase